MSEPEPDPPDTATPPGPTRRWAWLGTARGKVAAAAGTIITGVLVALIVQAVSPHTPGATDPLADPPSPTRTAVTFRSAPTTPATAPLSTASATSSTVSAASRAAYIGAPGRGWSVSPVTSSNDYVSVTVAMDPSEACDGARGWVFPQKPDALPPVTVTNAASIDAWARANGGVPQSGNYLTLTVFAVGNHSVVINDFGVRVVARSAPLGGTNAALSAGCGAIEPAWFSADLDTTTAVAKPVAGHDSLGHAVPATPLPHLVTSGQPESWRLQVTTKRCECEYIPYFDWSSDNNAGRYDVTLRGQPWRVTATTNAVPAYQNGTGWTRF